MAPPRYDVPRLPVDGLQSGAYLVAGPAIGYKYDLICDALTRGQASGEGSVFVSTNKGLSSLARTFEWEDGTPPESFSVVDCISEGGGPDRSNVAYVGSAGDLTGIGMYTSSQLSRLSGLGYDRIRVGLHSASTLFMYEEFETVLRFLNVFSHRIEHAGALGLIAMNTDSHDDHVVESTMEFVSGVIEYRSGEDGGEIRVVEGRDRSEWHPV